MKRQVRVRGLRRHLFPHRNAAVLRHGPNALVSAIESEPNLNMAWCYSLMCARMYLLSLAKSVTQEECARSKIGFLALSRELTVRPAASPGGEGVAELLAVELLNRLKKDIVDR